MNIRTFLTGFMALCLQLVSAQEEMKEDLRVVTSLKKI